MRMLVCFLSADSDLMSTHILNKAAAYVSGDTNPMIHTEILFVDQSNRADVVGRACSIHYGGKVFLENKRFSRNQWRFRSVSCSDAQVKAALQFCQSKVGEPFNKLGYFLNPVCAPRRLRDDSWFCSEIVAGALQAAGLDVEPSLHPHALYKSIRDLTTPDCPRDMKEMLF